ncbi:MAG: beta-ketoacyl-ACP synthase II [bacterium]|nr:beta-ketoacyl-ACP synthase II [bacterium]
MDKRVVITGTGAITCAGNDVNEFWDSVINGRCGITKVNTFDTSEFRTQIGGHVKNFDITKYMSVKEARRLDRFCQFAIAAGDEALSSAGLTNDLNGVNPKRVGVLVSSGIGGISTIETQASVLAQKGPGKVSPFLVPMMIINLASGNLAIRYGAKGPNISIATACASSTHSIGESFWMIKRGDADVMITGGAETGISPLSYAGFCSMKAMSQRNDDPLTASRPFDADREGFVIGEGAGVLVLEELEHAKKRGANILAEVVGYGLTADAYHITAPAPGGAGLADAMRMALDHAGIQTSDVDYINAHGTSTPLNDKFETLAIKDVFGGNAYNIPISSIKGTIGHNLGASGAIETISCVKTLQNNIIPPTINYTTKDPDCDLDYTPNTARETEVDIALNSNLAFGGHNAALILKKYK